MIVDGPSSPPFSFRSPSGNPGSGMVMALDATNDEDYDVFSNSTPHRLHELSPNTSSFFTARKHNFSTAATMDVHFTEWFNEIIERRKNLSAVTTAAVVFLSLFLIFTLLQISIIHPIDSIFNIFATFFSWKVWLLFLTCGLSTSLSLKYGFLNLISANQLRHLSIWAKSNWISAFIFTTLFHTNSMAVIGATSIEYLDAFSISVLAITLFSGTLFTVFRTDHQLIFEEPELGIKILPLLKTIYVERGQALALSASISAAKIYRNIYIPALVVGLPIFGSPILWSIVDFRLHAIALLTLAFTIFTIDSAIIFTRFFVMQPISFPLPPPYAIVAPSGSQLRTLTNALKCADPLLKLFAGYDLRRVGTCDLARRGEVYALSQPGGHPRNWTSISNSCFAIIQRVQREVENAASEYLMPCERNEESPDRKMLLMPSSMRNQIYTSAARQRVNRALLRPHKQKMNKGNILAGIIPSKYYVKFFNWMTPDKMIISRYDANMVVYAIEGISWLIVKSLKEDKFGVVQRDIHRLTSLMILTMQTIDKYFGVRNFRPVANGPDAPLLLIDRVLRTDIKNITDTFSSYLRGLEFTSEELRIIELLK